MWDVYKLIPMSAIVKTEKLLDSTANIMISKDVSVTSSFKLTITSHKFLQREEILKVSIVREQIDTIDFAR